MGDSWTCRQRVETWRTLTRKTTRGLWLRLRRTSQWPRSLIHGVIGPRSAKLWKSKIADFEGCVVAVTPFIVWRAVNFLQPLAVTLKLHLSTAWRAINFMQPLAVTLKLHLSTPSEGLWKSVLIVGLLRSLWHITVGFSRWCVSFNWNWSLRTHS